ncbi:MAG: hypothetical protein Greene041679_551 [Parcubacteria group bacterium Greene0416_79]|nr:MAG: hypothetical protein Greene041679_551 [Parcubacteria group bacterium Greene0416_79]
MIIALPWRRIGLKISTAMNLFEHIERKAVVGGLIALALVLIVSWYLLRDSSTEETDALLTELPGPALDLVLGRDLLIALSRLKKTELDVGFFGDPVFLSLRDFGVAIAPQPVGRRNPFALFSAAEAATSSRRGASSVILPARGAGRGTLPQGGAGGRQSPNLDFAF